MLHCHIFNTQPLLPLFMAKELCLCPSFTLRAGHSDCSTNNGQHQWILEMTMGCSTVVSSLIGQVWWKLGNTGQVQTQLHENTPTGFIMPYKGTGLHCSHVVCGSNITHNNFWIQKAYSCLFLLSKENSCKKHFPFWHTVALIRLNTLANFQGIWMMIHKYFFHSWLAVWWIHLWSNKCACSF